MEAVAPSDAAEAQERIAAILSDLKAHDSLRMSD
jgi:hypothetical protein